MEGESQSNYERAIFNENRMKCAEIIFRNNDRIVFIRIRWSFQSEDVDEEDIIPRMSQSELENKTTATVRVSVESSATAIDFLWSTFIFRTS